jgi:drug/metabolite transporter (DMT)-like permease
MGLVQTEFPGEVAALSAAIIWAVASVIYTGIGRHLSPLVLNLVKGLIAIGFILLTLGWRGQSLVGGTPTTLMLLGLSGVIGIGIGDTAYFQSLNDIGARRSLVLESLAPPLAAILAHLFLREYLSTRAWIGILVTIVGVTWVVLERVQDNPEFRQPNLRGIGCGMLAALCQALGAVLSRSALSGTEIDPLWSTLIRLAAGVLTLLLWVGTQKYAVRELKVLRSRRLLFTLAGTAFASTYIAIWLQQTALKYAPAGVAQALSATSPVFVLPIAMVMGEKVSLRAMVGVLVAMVGIWLLFGR